MMIVINNYDYFNDFLHKREKLSKENDSILF